MEEINKLKNLYRKKKSAIKSKIDEFRKTLKDEKKIFAELAFCLLTPQSKAKICWEAIEALSETGLLLNGTRRNILPYLKGVRFKNKKAEYIVSARKLFIKNGKIEIKNLPSSFKSLHELREFLVKSVNGMGYKEASHFLRNIGLGEEIAILDRHILKNMKKYGVIDEIPEFLSKKKYLELEQKFINFSKKCSIPVAHLDLLLWFKETGEIFK